MAGAFLEVDYNEEQTRSLLLELCGRMEDMTPVFAEIGEIVTESVQRNFEEHRAPDGTPWAPLAPSTVAARAKKGRSSKDILIFNRILMGSIHPEAHRDHVRVGTDIIYGAVHQFGIGWRTNLAIRRTMPAIPARPYLGVRDDDWPEFNDVIQAFLTGAQG